MCEILGIVVEAQDGRTRPVLPLPDSTQEEPDTAIASTRVPEVVLLPNGMQFVRRELHPQIGNGGNRGWTPDTGIQAGELPHGTAPSAPPAERSFQKQMHDIYEAFGNGTDIRSQLEARFQTIKAQ